LNNREAFSTIVTRNERMGKILKVAELHAVSDSPILITGETGTGKELFARAVHAASQRCRQPFTPINMDAVAGTLFDSEFFGHTKGAFTGADKEREGYLERTHKGTLFLDEIGNLPLELQGRLLRVLQDGEFIKIGTNSPRKVDVRIIAATNKDLDKMMEKKLFRRDLYYRLSGGWLQLPPLRERSDDIPLLIRHFLQEFCGTAGGEVEEEAMKLLLAYNYPGNVRELKSIVKSALNLSRGQVIRLDCLPSHLPLKVNGLKKNDPERARPIETLAELEKAHILKAYRLLNRNKAECGRVLGIGINTLRRKLEQYGIK
jgi:transcriptional regulator with PAS, ATPase and Fis domain